MKKQQKSKTNEAYVMVGVIIITLLLLLAYIIKSNRIDEEQELLSGNRIERKVEQVREVKNSVKRLVK